MFLCISHALCGPRHEMALGYEINFRNLHLYFKIRVAAPALRVLQSKICLSMTGCHPGVRHKPLPPDS